MIKIKIIIIIIIIIIICTPLCRILLEKLTGLQLVKKFPAFHENRRFITTLTSVRHLSLSCASPIQVHILTSHLLEIHSNIIHPSKSRSPQNSNNNNNNNNTVIKPLFVHVQTQQPITKSTLIQTCSIHTHKTKKPKTENKVRFT